MLAPRVVEKMGEGQARDLALDMLVKVGLADKRDS